MSLFGYFVIAKSDAPLVELPSIQRLCSVAWDGIGPGVPGGQQVDGEWQLLQVLGGFGLEVTEVVAETSAPALTVYVMESEIGMLSAAAPDGSRCDGFLNPVDAVRAFDFPSDLVDSVEETTDGACRLAGLFGRQPDRAAVAAAVGSRVGPFGEGVTDFVYALGFRFREPINP